MGVSDGRRVSHQEIAIQTDDQVRLAKIQVRAERLSECHRGAVALVYMRQSFELDPAGVAEPLLDEATHRRQARGR